MFEEIFSRPTALRRHREGPLASERQEYLQHLKDRGAAADTVIRQARYCLSIAREIQQYPQDYCFQATELEAIAASWAARRVKQGWADTPRWPKENFCSVAHSFLEWLGRLAHDPDPPPGPYDALVEDFLKVECEGRGGLFAGCSHFLMFKPHSLLATLVAPTTTVSCRAVSDVYIRAKRASLPPHVPDMLAVRHRQLTAHGLSPR